MLYDDAGSNQWSWDNEAAGSKASEWYACPDDFNKDDVNLDDSSVVAEDQAQAGLQKKISKHVGKVNVPAPQQDNWDVFENKDLEGNDTKRKDLSDSSSAGSGSHSSGSRSSASLSDSDDSASQSSAEQSSANQSDASASKSEGSESPAESSSASDASPSSGSEDSPDESDSDLSIGDTENSKSVSQSISKLDISEDADAPKVDFHNKKLTTTSNVAGLTDAQLLDQPDAFDEFMAVAAQKGNANFIKGGSVKPVHGADI